MSVSVGLRHGSCERGHRSRCEGGESEASSRRPDEDSGGRDGVREDGKEADTDWVTEREGGSAAP